MAINLNFDETVSVYASVLAVLRGIREGEIDPQDPDLAKIIQLGEMDEKRLASFDSAYQDFEDDIAKACENFNKEMGEFEAAYTPKSS